MSTPFRGSINEEPLGMYAIVLSEVGLQHKCEIFTTLNIVISVVDSICLARYYDPCSDTNAKCKLDICVIPFEYFVDIIFCTIL